MAEKVGGEIENYRAPLSTHIILSSAQIFRKLIHLRNSEKWVTEKSVNAKLISKQLGNNDHDPQHILQATKYASG